MKKIFLFFAAALLCANMNADQAVTINNAGNTTQAHFPVYGDNVDVEGHKVQAIYLADQLKSIAVGSEIKALTFYSANQNQAWGKTEFKVSLAQTDYTSFPNTSGVWATASSGSTLTQVYDGPLSVADGELTVHFTTPYTYEGGNLLIQVEISRKGTSASSSFYAAATTDYLIKYANSGSSREAKQPKITLVMAGGGDDPVSQTCAAPTAATLVSVTDATATVSWEGEAAQYQYCLTFEGDQPDWTHAQLTNQKSVTLPGLYDEQKYYLYIRSYCSATEVSETVKVTFKTACARANVPWIETFTRDDASSEWSVATPDCWIISSENPDVFVTRDKTYDDEGNAQTVYTQAHLAARGGGSSPQVFAMPAMNGRLDTLEVAFDYKTNVENDDEYARLEVGYMTNPYNASSFVSLRTLPQVTDYTHVVVTLEDVPAEANFIAFRFAGGTSTFGSVSMDNFIVAGIGKSAEVDPADEELPDPSVWSLSYCDAGYTWYYYGSEQYFGMLLLSEDLQDTVAAVFTSTGDCEQFAMQDGVEFSNDDPYAEQHYYFNTRYILNVDEAGLMKFGAFDACTVNIGGSGANAQLGLKPGNYTVVVYELIVSTDEETETSKVEGLGDRLSSIPFTIVSKEISHLAVAIADDHATATLTWDAPEYGQGERLYVRVWAGETVAYDNFDTNERPTSPLTVNVIEGKSYTVIAQVIDKNLNPLGAEVETNFTVGTNPYEPTNVNAEVFSGDNVTFSWDVTTQADRYVITLLCDGEFYATLNVSGTTKTTTMPKDGTWTWTIQAFNIGENDKYFEASNAIEGNAFVSHATDIPEDAIQMNVWGMDAGYLDQYTTGFPEGKYGWMVMFATGEEGGTGMPMPYFLIWSDKEYAISGVYNVARGNIDLESCYINTDGTQDGCIMATDAEVRLQFVAYDDEKAEKGYRYGYYTGQFRIVTTEGKTYVGKFMETFCNSFNYSTAGSIRDHKGMWDEDPDYIDPSLQGIEEIQVPEEGVSKILLDGNLYIMHDGRMYDIRGTRVK